MDEPRDWSQFTGPREPEVVNGEVVKIEDFLTADYLLGEQKNQLTLNADKIPGVIKDFDGTINSVTMDVSVKETGNLVVRFTVKRPISMTFQMSEANRLRTQLGDAINLAFNNNKRYQVILDGKSAPIEFPTK